MQPCLPKELRPCVKHHHRIIGRAKHHGCIAPRPKDCLTTPLGPCNALPAGPLASAPGGALAIIPKGVALPISLSIGGGFVAGIALAEGGFFGSGYGGPILDGQGGASKLHSCPKGEVGTYPHCIKPNPIPEPATYLLLFLGLVILLTMSSLRRKVK